MKIAVGADHGGCDLKSTLKAALEQRGHEVEDCGTFGSESVDYPDFAKDVAQQVSLGQADQGLLVCTTGIGMSIAANKFPGVRAALCCSPDLARAARNHNDANVLVLGQAVTSQEERLAILDAWLDQEIIASRPERHMRRVRKIQDFGSEASRTIDVWREDPEVAEAILGEMRRQQQTINLIASENYVSPAVREAQGCVMTNKYAEGYPGKRWYNGCKCVDVVESLAIERAKSLFGADHANVQPHCGSSANMGVYFASLEPGDTILAMSLAHGGHLTHGHAVNFSGRLFNVVHYGVDPETELIDYDAVDAMAKEHKPRMIVCGASAYPRILDFPRFRAIADSVGAYLTVDMAHIAGLVAAGVHPSPVPHAEFVTTTTHKTLRGPRHGMILCREEFAKKIDTQVFPGLQGGPQMHAIAGKAVCLHEAAQPAFKEYGVQIVKNAQVMAETLTGEGLRIVSGGTDNHLMLVDLTALGVTGKDAADALERVNIVANKNAIPFDTRSPFVTSGIRLGTPALTTRGMKEDTVRALSKVIAAVVREPGNEDVQAKSAEQVRQIAEAHPVW